MVDVTILYSPPAAGPYWDWRVAADLFAGGIGVGAFLFAVLADWRYGDVRQRVCQTAAWIAPFFVAAGLLMLLAEMGHPERIVYALISFHPTSPLWWGGIFQSLFIIGASVYALLWFDPASRVTQRRRLGGIVLPIAIVVGAYHGFLLAFMRARPLWNNGPSLVIAVLGFITTGLAAVLLTHLIRARLTGRIEDGRRMGAFFADMREVRLILGFTLIIQAFTIFVWWIALHFGQGPGQVALEVANRSFGPVFWLGALGIGIAVPLAIGGLVVLGGNRVSTRLEIHAVWVTSALILIGGFLMRFAVTAAGQLS
jgi:formate-dependent nitrite reductase membrane component NrfD